MSVFSEEITRVKRKVVLKRRLLHLCPFLDKHAILCVGGRSEHSQIPHVERDPMILPKNYDVTKLIVRSEHLCLLHASLTLSLCFSKPSFLHSEKLECNSFYHSQLCNM